MYDLAVSDGDINDLYGAATFYLDELQSKSLAEFAWEYKQWMNPFLTIPRSERPANVMQALKLCNKIQEPSIFRLLKVSTTHGFTF